MKTQFFRKLALLSALALVSASVSAAPADSLFIINGTLQTFREGKIFLIRYYAQGREVDSSVISGGKFRFTGKMKDDIVSATLMMHVPATEAQLAERPFANMSVRMFYLSAGNIVVDGNRLEDVRFSGNREAQEFMQLEGMLEPLHDASTELAARFRKANAMADTPAKTDSLAVIRKASEANAKAYRETERRFVREHPGSLMGMAMVRMMMGMAENKDAAEMVKLANGLSPALRDRDDIREQVQRMQLLATLVPGKPAPLFSMTDTSGKSVSLKDYRGKYVLVECWASWCAPCRSQIPFLLKSYEAFKDKNFDILGVSIDGHRDKWTHAIREEQLRWTQVSDLKGHKSEIMQLYGITAIPSNYLLDPQGNIIASNLWNDELYAKLQELLP